MTTALAIAIPVLIVLAGVTFFVTARRSDANRAMGSLSRETRRRDRGGVAPSAEATPPAAKGREVELAAAASRRGELEKAPPVAIAPYAPPDEDQVAMSRRQFFNRANTTLMGVSLGAFGASLIAFLWKPQEGGSFGGNINAGTVDEVRQGISDGTGFFYLAAGKTWITEYPAGALTNAEKVYPPPVVEGMRAGFVALYQKCPHLGCRVPECVSSQWFECPCHGSQYNRSGEKKGGPAPRGMDHFALTVSGGNVSVDTAKAIPGAVIGTNTTGQEAEGPHCVSGGEGGH